MEDLAPSSSNRGRTRGRGQGNYVGNNFSEGYQSRARGTRPRPYRPHSAYPSRNEITNHRPALVGHHGANSNSNDPSPSTSHPDDLTAPSTLFYGSPPRKKSNEYRKNNTVSAAVPDLSHSGNWGNAYYEQKRTKIRKQTTLSRFRDSGYEPRIKQEQEQGPGPPDALLHPSYPGSSQQRKRQGSTGSISSSAPNSPTHRPDLDLSNQQTKSLLERVENGQQQRPGPSLLERLKVKTEDVELDWGLSSRSSRWAGEAGASGRFRRNSAGDGIATVQTNGNTHNPNDTDRDASVDMVVSDDLQDDLDQQAQSQVNDDYHDGDPIPGLDSQTHSGTPASEAAVDKFLNELVLESLGMPPYDHNEPGEIPNTAGIESMPASTLDGGLQPDTNIESDTLGHDSNSHVNTATNYNHCRELLMPVIMQNTTLRADHEAGSQVPVRVLRTVLSDDICGTFIAASREITEQLDGRKQDKEHNFRTVDENTNALSKVVNDRNSVENENRNENADMALSQATQRMSLQAETASSNLMVNPSTPSPAAPTPGSSQPKEPPKAPKAMIMLESLNEPQVAAFLSEQSNQDRAPALLAPINGNDKGKGKDKGRNATYNHDVDKSHSKPESSGAWPSNANKEEYRSHPRVASMGSRSGIDDIVPIAVPMRGNPNMIPINVKSEVFATPMNSSHLIAHSLSAGSANYSEVRGRRDYIHTDRRPEQPPRPTSPILPASFTRRRSRSPPAKKRREYSPLRPPPISAPLGSRRRSRSPLPRRQRSPPSSRRRSLSPDRGYQVRHRARSPLPPQRNSRISPVRRRSPTPPLRRRSLTPPVRRRRSPFRRPRSPVPRRSPPIPRPWNRSRSPRRPFNTHGSNIPDRPTNRARTPPRTPPRRNSLSHHPTKPLPPNPNPAPAPPEDAARTPPGPPPSAYHDPLLTTPPSLLPSDPNPEDIPEEKEGIPPLPSEDPLPPPSHVSSTEVPKLSPPLVNKTPVPGIWFAKTGLGGPRIFDFDFEVERETAEYWGLPNFASIEAHESVDSKPHVSVSLCLLCQSMNVILTTSKPLFESRASREIVTTTLSNLPISWPPQGQLIVEFNTDKHWGRTWLPLDIHPDRPLDVTNHVREGINNVRLTQLDDLSPYTFSLLASPAAVPDRDFSDLVNCLASFREPQNVTDSGIFAMEATMRVYPS